MRLTAQQNAIIQNVLTGAEFNLNVLLNMRVKLSIKSIIDMTADPEKDNIYELMREVAEAMGMCLGDYDIVSRQFDHRELRCIAIHFIRERFPQYRNTDKLRKFFLKDASTIKNYIRMHRDLLQEGNERYTNKYNKATEAVNSWAMKLKKNEK